MNYSTKYSEDCKAATKSILKKFLTWVPLNVCMHSYRIRAYVCREEEDSKKHCELTVFLRWAKTFFRLVEGQHFFCLPCLLPTARPFRKQFQEGFFCGGHKVEQLLRASPLWPWREGGCSTLCCPTPGKIHFSICEILDSSAMEQNCYCLQYNRNNNKQSYMPVMKISLVSCWETRGISLLAAEYVDFFLVQWSLEQDCIW